MVSILLATGFEETEALAPCDLLRRAGVQTTLVGVNGTAVTGSHGITVQADLELDDLPEQELDMLVLPGGLRGVQSLLASEKALELIKRVRAAGKWVCAICAAPTILAKLGLIADEPVTCYPGKVPEMGGANTVDASVDRSGRLITGRAAGSSLDFALALIEALKGREEADRIAKQIVYIR